MYLSAFALKYLVLLLISGSPTEGTKSVSLSAIQSRICTIHGTLSISWEGHS